MPQTDIVALPFAELAARMASGALTSQALVLECLERIARQDDHLHAFVDVFGEHALAAARGLDAERTKGRVRGPLHGIPLAVKDLVDVEGHVTGFGSLAYGSRPAAQTAPFLRRLEEAGMIVVGKTQMVEFAFGSWGTNHALGTPRNPHDPAVHHVPGGSSSGSAVAVAGRLVPAAIGSDTGGSVRIPASLCGTVGLKTTVGQIDTRGVAPLSPTFDTIGPLTNHVDDARLIFEAMCPQAGLRGRPDAECRIVRVVDRRELHPIDPDVLAAFDRSVELFAGLGLDVRPIALPRRLVDYQADNGAIMAKEAFASLRHLVEDHSLRLDPSVRARVAQGTEIDDARYARLLAERRKAVTEFGDRLGADEVLALPTTPLPATPLQEVDEAVFPMSRFTRLGNYLDLCGISLPVGAAASGMPVGLQLLARGGCEALLLNTAAAIERALAAPGSAVGAPLAPAPGAMQHSR